MQFAQVEQQIKQNAAQDPDLAQKGGTDHHRACLCRTTVAIDGETAALSTNKAAVDVQRAEAVDRHGHDPEHDRTDRVFRQLLDEHRAMQTFEWDGRDANGRAMADGNYTISVTAKDTSGQTGGRSRARSRAWSTRSTSPKTRRAFSRRRLNYTLDKIKRVVRTN